MMVQYDVKCKPELKALVLKVNFRLAPQSQSADQLPSLL